MKWPISLLPPLRALRKPCAHTNRTWVCRIRTFGTMSPNRIAGVLVSHSVGRRLGGYSVRCSGVMGGCLGWQDAIVPVAKDLAELGFGILATQVRASPPPPPADTRTEPLTLSFCACDCG